MDEQPLRDVQSEKQAAQALSSACDQVADGTPEMLLARACGMLLRLTTTIEQMLVEREEVERKTCERIDALARRVELLYERGEARIERIARIEHRLLSDEEVDESGGIPGA